MLLHQVEVFLHQIFYLSNWFTEKSTQNSGYQYTQRLPLGNRVQSRG